MNENQDYYIKLASVTKYLWNRADELNPGLPEKAFTAVKTVGASMITAYFVSKALSFLDDAVFEPAATKQSLTKMLEKNPELLKADPEEVADLFKTLYTQNPYIAADPIAAGAFITQMIQKQVRRDYGGPTIDIYGTLATMMKDKAQANSSRATTSPLDNAFSNLQGLKGVLGLGVE